MLLSLFLLPKLVLVLLFLFSPLLLLPLLLLLSQPLSASEAGDEDSHLGVAKMTLSPRLL